MSLIPYALVRPFLFKMDPEEAHEFTLDGLSRTQNTPLDRFYRQPFVSNPVTLAGLKFPNRVGLAAGLDKNARCIDAFAAMGGTASVRLKEGQPLVTDNGQHIVDVKGLSITDPVAFEMQVSQWPGVVTVGVFALQKAQVCLLGTSQGVKTLTY